VPWRAGTRLSATSLCLEEATAVAGAAAVLVTGDEDLLAVAAEAPIRILAPRSFWELLRHPATD
jgi:predicted nucleic acid-binding protein